MNLNLRKNSISDLNGNVWSSENLCGILNGFGFIISDDVRLILEISTEIRKRTLIALSYDKFCFNILCIDTNKPPKALEKTFRIVEKRKSHLNMKYFWKGRC